MGDSVARDDSTDSGSLNGEEENQVRTSGMRRVVEAVEVKGPMADQKAR